MKNIWNKKAQNFPRFKKDAQDTLEVIEFFKDNGVVFNNKSMLDIGAGNGRFTLELAFLAKEILAQDISSLMLENITQDAKALGLDNVKTCECDFSDFSEESKFQIIMASMTPALNNKKNFLKAYSLAEEAFCTLGWGRERKSEILEEIMQLHNAKLELPKGLPNYLEWLDEENISYKNYKYFSAPVTYSAAIPKAIEDIAWHISVHNVEPDLKLIENFVNKKAVDGILSYTHIREVGAMCVLKNQA